MIPELSSFTPDTLDRLKDPLGEGGGLVKEVHDHILARLQSLEQLVGLGGGFGQTGHSQHLGLQHLGLGAIRADLHQTLGDAKLVGKALDHMDLEYQLMILYFGYQDYFCHVKLPEKWA